MKSRGVHCNEEIRARLREKKGKRRKQSHRIDFEREVEYAAEEEGKHLPKLKYIDR
jgi:hypothetical protein